MNQPIKPECRAHRIVAESALFYIEQLELIFSNGAMRHFERIHGRAKGSILIIPMLTNETILLIREYAAGVDRYELGFPKGLREAGEDPLESANRELMEEVGYGARDLRLLKTVTLSPGYMSAATQVILARDLYPKQLPGDEPEKIEVVPWHLSDIEALMAREDFTEARSIAALFMVKDWLTKEEF